MACLSRDGDDVGERKSNLAAQKGVGSSLFSNFVIVLISVLYWLLLRTIEIELVYALDTARLDAHMFFDFLGALLAWCVGLSGQLCARLCTFLALTSYQFLVH